MIPAATSFTLEPRRAVSRTRAPFRDAGILTRIPVRLVLLAAIVLAAYHGLANGASRRRVALVDDAAAVAREQLALRGVRLRIACGVVGAGRRALPHDVGRHAGADHGGPTNTPAPRYVRRPYRWWKRRYDQSVQISSTGSGPDQWERR